MMRGRSTCWQCLSSLSSTAYPAAVIGIVSIGPASSAENKVPTAARFPDATIVPLCQTSYRQLRAGPPSGVARKIALQRAHLEVSLQVGLNALRRRDGPGKSGVVRDFMQEGGTPQ